MNGTAGVTREQLLPQLAEASELEHNLLCSYLFALFSLKRRRDENLTQFNRPNLPVALGCHPAQIVVGLTPFNAADLPVGDVARARLARKLSDMRRDLQPAGPAT